MHVLAFDEATWTFFGVCITAMFGLVGVIIGGRASRKATRVEDKVDTGNERKIGTYVHDMAQEVELLAARQHTDTRELVQLHERLSEHIEESREVHEGLIEQMAAIRRLIEEQGETA